MPKFCIVYREWKFVVIVADVKGGGFEIVGKRKWSRRRVVVVKGAKGWIDVSAALCDRSRRTWSRRSRIVIVSYRSIS